MKILVDRESVAKENNELKRYFCSIEEEIEEKSGKIYNFQVHPMCGVADRREQAAEARNRKHQETRFYQERLMITFGFNIYIHTCYFVKAE